MVGAVADLGSGVGFVAFIAVVPGVAGAFDEAFDAVGTGSRVGLRFVDDVVDVVVMHVEAVGHTELLTDS